ncbi:spore germination protein [Clostridium sp. YIM B02515]|uniref:Spore germination protein n=1 Tax=Clostridium rhizosphaerae TaxID=2803861 RepID=A0ABS1TAS5_9CLOT|nr:spore germination protein [Clostridium rhizosphaerae]MBL4936452.1 spore germination protein [Clostridium rhizosphaerae]
MFNIIKKLLYKSDKSSGIQYKDIETAINKSFNNTTNNSAASKKLTPSTDIEKNKRYITTVFQKCSDIMLRELNITSNPNYKAVCIYVANMIPTELIEDTILRKFTQAPQSSDFSTDIKAYCMSLLGVAEDDLLDDMNKIVDAIVEGELVLFVNGINKAFTVDIKKPPARAVDIPPTESILRGPREGFIESHGTNICLVRKKIKSPNLKTEGFKAGKETKTNITMMYMSNIANEKIVDEVRNRINKIDIDSVLGASYIEEYIEDNPFSIFPTIFRTEKPDVAAGKILEGRIIIFVDTIPVALSIPSIFGEYFMSPDDYYLRFYVATLNRWVRMLAFALSLALPSAYVSLITYHQELLPTSLIISVVRGRANIPFPPMFEALFMLTTYLVLQEADVRMPKTMGQSVSIVGGLVLGQAAINAGIVSAHMIIVVAFSAVASLAVPTVELQLPLSYVRVLLLILGGFGGMVGLTCGLIAIIMHLLSLRSFGVPFLAPAGPLKPNELKDIFIRAPLWSLKKLPKTITWKDSYRRKGRPATNPITQENKEHQN